MFGPGESSVGWNARETERAVVIHAIGTSLRCSSFCSPASPTPHCWSGASGFATGACRAEPRGSVRFTSARRRRHQADLQRGCDARPAGRLISVGARDQGGAGNPGGGGHSAGPQGGIPWFDGKWYRLSQGSSMSTSACCGCCQLPALHYVNRAGGWSSNKYAMLARCARRRR